MFQLMLATMAGLFDADVRAFAWKVDHWTLIWLSYVVLPASFVWTAVRSICYGSHRLALASALLSLPPFLVRNLLVWKVDSHWFCELLGRPSRSSYRCTRYYSGGNAEWIWGCEFSLSEYALVPSTGHTATGRRRRATLVEDHETHSCSKAARTQPKTRRDSCQTRGAHLHCWTGGTVCSKPELFHIGNWRNWFVWHFTIRNPEATGHRNPGSRGL